MKDKVIQYLQKEYDDDKIEELIDSEIINGNWADDYEEDGYESENDWYQDFGRGEAETTVRDQIELEILAEFEITIQEYKIETGEDLYETIQNLFDKLDA